MSAVKELTEALTDEAMDGKGPFWLTVCEDDPTVAVACVQRLLQNFAAKGSKESPIKDWPRMEQSEALLTDFRGDLEKLAIQPWAQRHAEWLERQEPEQFETECERFDIIADVSDYLRDLEVDRQIDDRLEREMRGAL